MGLIREFIQTGSHLRRHHHDHQEGAPILRVANLSVRYDSGYALQDLSFELTVGGRTAVVGPNGAGKSTLFKVIAGVIPQSKGEVHVYGHEPGGHICIAYVPQRSQVDWSFPVTVSDVVMMGRIGKMGLFRQRMSRDQELVNRARSTRSSCFRWPAGRSGNCPAASSSGCLSPALWRRKRNSF